MTVYVVFGSGAVGKALFLALFERADAIDLVGHSRIADEAIEQIRREKPELVIVEEILTHGWGMDIVQSLADRNGTPGVVMISTMPPPRTRREYVSQGIDLWLQLPQDFEQLQWTLLQLTTREPGAAIAAWRRKLDHEGSGQENSQGEGRSEE